MEATRAFLTAEPPVQLKLTHCDWESQTLLWNYLAKVTSLAHLSLPYIQLYDDFPCIIFAFTPRFADQPLKNMKIGTQSESGQLMVDVRQIGKGLFSHMLSTWRWNDRVTNETKFQSYRFAKIVYFQHAINSQ